MEGDPVEEKEEKKEASEQVVEEPKTLTQKYRALSPVKQIFVLIAGMILACMLADFIADVVIYGGPKIEWTRHVDVPDFVALSKSDVVTWKNKNDLDNLSIVVDEKYSDTIPKGQIISQNPPYGSQIDNHSYTNLYITVSAGKKQQSSKDSSDEKKKKEETTSSFSSSSSSSSSTSSSSSSSSTTAPSQRVPDEYTRAFRVAKEYTTYAPLSRQKLYEQLTEYENFSHSAAQYALDHLDINYNLNALKSAREYLSYTSMSDDMLYDQLTSPYGDAFTPSEAQYAISHL